MKPFLTAVLILTSLGVYSQTDRNSFLIGGNASLSYQETKYTSSFGSNYKTTSASVSPSVGFFVIKNLCAGLALPVSFSTTKYDNNSSSISFGNSKSKSYGVGPFVRYYYPLTDNKLFLLAEGAYSWSKGINNTSAYDINTNTTEPVKYTIKNNIYRLGAGVAFFLNEHTSLELLGNYQKSKSTSDQNPNYFILTDTKASNIFLSLGLKVYIPAK
ncbi:MAG TPA: outer membrane beta-barrel protein [Cyclobacteriaceae bacterium]